VRHAIVFRNGRGQAAACAPLDHIGFEAIVEKRC
jgi:hypothetical protein